MKRIISLFLFAAGLATTSLACPSSSSLANFSQTDKLPSQVGKKTNNDKKVDNGRKTGSNKKMENGTTVRFSDYFTDNMVLPRQRKFTMKGKGIAGKTVTLLLTHEQTGKVAFRGQGKCSSKGTWTVEVDGLPQGGPYTFTAKQGGASCCIRNVLVGELWLASGQSNMAFQLCESITSKEDIQHSDNSSIRLLDLKPYWSTDNSLWAASAVDSVSHLLYYQDAAWTVCSSATSPAFSAVAYHFARTLQDSLQCPVGIICNAIGGSGEEAWIDRKTLQDNYPSILNDWTRNDLIQPWVRGRAKLNMGVTDELKGKRHPYEPCYLYEASIEHLCDMPIKGVIWYQGESNAQSTEPHAHLFPLLLQSWRQTWHNPELPFIYTQLSSLSRPTWPEFRDLQRKQLYQLDGHLTPHLGMAVTSDVGDSLNVHPREKTPVGYRLALWALHNEYGHPCTCSGPLASRAEQKGNELLVHFDFSNGLSTSDGQTLRTFEVTTDGQTWLPVEANIKGNVVQISTKGIETSIMAVRYGWQPFTRANLVNGDKLPASTFCLDVN